MLKRSSHLQQTKEKEGKRLIFEAKSSHKKNFWQKKHGLGKTENNKKEKVPLLTTHINGTINMDTNNNNNNDK
jgi:hypothetical protein